MRQANLARLGEKDNLIRWQEQSLERVWRLTHGHPFLTQQLCSHVWGRLYENTRDTQKEVTPTDVELSIDPALDSSRGSLEWLWDGLPPAERIVLAALASIELPFISQETLENTLRNNGIRIIIRELQLAPRLLQEWDLIEPVDGGYRFCVELLRLWIARYKSLSFVQREIDRIKPAADNLFRAALDLYQSGQLDQALEPLKQAISLNPYHIDANLTFAEILLAQNRPGEARRLLENLYTYHPTAVRPRLIQTLVSQAWIATKDVEKLTLFDRVLELDPDFPEAKSEKQRILAQRRLHELKLKTDVRDRLENEENYVGALEYTRQLVETYPADGNWNEDVKRLERKKYLFDAYRSGLKAFEQGDLETAKNLLGQVAALQADYEQVTRYLHWAVTGVDPNTVSPTFISRNPSASIWSQEGANSNQVQPNHGAATKPKKSNPPSLNLLQGLRLTWWSLMRPRTLRQQQHRELLQLRKVSAWLASTLLWLPLLLPLMGIAVGSWLLQLQAISSSSVLLASGIALISAAWIVTGRILQTEPIFGEDEIGRTIIAGVLPGCVAIFGGAVFWALIPEATSASRLLLFFSIGMAVICGGAIANNITSSNFRSITLGIIIGIVMGARISMFYGPGGGITFIKEVMAGAIAGAVVGGSSGFLLGLAFSIIDEEFGSKVGRWIAGIVGLATALFATVQFFTSAALLIIIDVLIFSTLVGLPVSVIFLFIMSRVRESITNRFDNDGMNRTALGTIEILVVSYLILVSYFFAEYAIGS